MHNLKSSLFAPLVSIIALSLVSATVSAQVDPTRIGAGQLPYIMIVLDTSGSTEWTDVGDERYPEDPTAVSPSLPEWVPGTPMKLDPSNPADGPKRFGPCMVWEANWSGGASCNNYVRPTWNVNVDAPSSWAYPAYPGGVIGPRFLAMQGDIPANKNPIRLKESSQPRHVTLKEVLTGDMVMRTADQVAAGTFPVWDPTLDGPGCWFVPRQRGASVQPLEDQDYCKNSSRFNEFPDFEEPRPHFQEVFEAQMPNGVLDRLSGQAIFAVAQLDGYKDDVTGWEANLNDNIKGSAPLPSVWRTGDEGSYNLGVYRIVGPDTLEIPTSYLGQLSSYTQVALVDSGWLQRSGGTEIDVKKNKPSGIGVSFDKQFEKYLKKGYKYSLGQQPIARATPLAAAVMDMHQHLLEDDVVQNDRFFECRPKQIVLVTDGYPEPERTGGAGSNIGSEALSPAFGYDDITQYKYDLTELEIKDLVDDTALLASDQRFAPRVHVVSLSVGGNTAQAAQVADKLSAMAIQGNTCAGAYLADSYHPDKGCIPSASQVCLVGGQRPFTYFAPDPDFNGGAGYYCKYPALILTKNDRAEIEKALFQILSGIISGSGVASRTRAVVSNRLDNDLLTEGGQYRVFSGVRIDGSPYWRGIINRQLVPCSATNAGAYDANSSTAAGIDTSGVVIQALHDEVASQVECNTSGNACLNPRDRRRIFTTFPAGTSYDYIADTPVSGQIGVNATAQFPFVYDSLVLDKNEDAISNDTTIPSATQPLFLAGTRIPLHSAQLKGATILGSTQSGTVFDDAGVSAFFALPGGASALTDDLDNMVNTYRGRIYEKSGVALDESRVFSGIVNSNPVVVGPPDLDIPVESYRTFRARYGDRPTMLMTATLDGLIHALHLGELNGRVKLRQSSATHSQVDVDAPPAKGAKDQREAWAYMPNFLMRRLSANMNSQPYFMDGTPTVKDVRLCQRDATKNQNRQACQVVSTGGFLTDDQIWRTVMVTGMGQAGDGYVAMDITRAGGLSASAASRTIDPPDPVVLWEFDRRWEAAQVVHLMATDPDRVANNSAPPDDYDNTDNGCSTANSHFEFWSQPMLGASVSEPEIGTVLLQTGVGVVEQRPIAVFGGGYELDGVSGCASKPVGSAIYVVDLQTGSILRRFVEYTDGGVTSTFAKPLGGGERLKFTGSPVLYDNFTGSVATRGFIGDNVGHLFRLDFTDPDPATWGVTMFFDPYADTSGSGMQSAADSKLGTTDVRFGPAAFKPAVSLAPDKSLIVTYGMGEVGDTTTAGQAQAVVTLQEDLGSRQGNVVWFWIMEEGEKLTGQPIIFNSAVYFPTYAVPSADICAPGFAQIYGLDYFDSGVGAPKGIFDPSNPQFAGPDVDVDTPDGRWFRPAKETLIRGLTITLGPQCNVQNLGAGIDSNGLEGTDAQPQLIAQTGGVPAGAMENKFGGDTVGKDTIGRLVADLPKPRSMTVPLSWSVVSN